MNYWQDEETNEWKWKWLFLSNKTRRTMKQIRGRFVLCVFSQSKRKQFEFGLFSSNFVFFFGSDGFRRRLLCALWPTSVELDRDSWSCRLLFVLLSRRTCLSIVWDWPCRWSSARLLWASWFCSIWKVSFSRKFASTIKVSLFQQTSVRSSTLSSAKVWRICLWCRWFWSSTRWSEAKFTDQQMRNETWQRTS